MLSRSRAHNILEISTSRVGQWLWGTVQLHNDNDNDNINLQVFQLMARYLLGVSLSSSECQPAPTQAHLHSAQ